jgi:tetratricopeptide (TPR) repeat protein
MIGRTLRQYRVTARLGAGGMGEVWKARDTILDRDVALKVLPAAATADPARKERFIREAKAASALNHPNIITIYEINADEGVDFIAMECVEGETLADRLAREPLSIEDVIQIAQQVADGVGRAHNAGIIHRDLKPGNIMITADGLVKVLDFGLAKFDETRQAAEDGTDMATRMAVTRVGAAMGTVGYMSPEQAIGDKVDARSDVFSFGVILHKMLTNELPFAAETQAGVLHKLHFAEPPPIESARPDAPPFLVAIARRALAKDPEDRFFTLAAVAAALRGRESCLPAAAGGDAAAPSRPPSLLRAIEMARELDAGNSRLPRPRRSVVALLVALLILVVWLIQLDRPGQPSEAGPALQPAASSPFELTQQAAALLARDDRQGNVDRAIDLLEDALAQDAAFALAHAHLSDAYLRRYRATQDDQWLRLGRETANRALQLNSDLAMGHVALGAVHVEARTPNEALPEFETAADLDPRNPLPHMGRGMALAQAGRDAEAVTAFQRGIELAPADWRPHMEFGVFLFQRARLQEAAGQFDEVVRLTPDNALALRNLGAVYFQLGRAEDAASSLQRSLEVQPSGPTFANLGTIRYFQGRYTDAVAAFETSVKLTANRHTTWGNLGDALRWAPGRRGEAAAAHRQASSLIAEQIKQSPGDANLLTQHAAYLAKMGDGASALAEVARIPANAMLTPQMLYRLTMVYELSGDRGRALSTLERALKAGYPAAELRNEPYFTELRGDVRYQRLIGQFQGGP